MRSKVTMKEACYLRIEQAKRDGKLPADVAIASMRWKHIPHGKEACIVLSDGDTVYIETTRYNTPS